MAVGLWHQSMMSVGRNSNLLEMGLVILAISCGVVGSVVALRYLTRRQRELKREEREDGRVVLVKARPRSQERILGAPGNTRGSGAESRR